MGVRLRKKLVRDHLKRAENNLTNDIIYIAVACAIVYVLSLLSIFIIRLFCGIRILM